VTFLFWKKTTRSGVFQNREIFLKDQMVLPSWAKTKFPTSCIVKVGNTQGKTIHYSIAWFWICIMERVRRVIHRVKKAHWSFATVPLRGIVLHEHFDPGILHSSISRAINGVGQYRQKMSDQIYVHPNTLKNFMTYDYILCVVKLKSFVFFIILLKDT